MTFAAATTKLCSSTPLPTASFLGCLSHPDWVEKFRPVGIQLNRRELVLTQSTPSYINQHIGSGQFHNAYRHENKVLKIPSGCSLYMTPEKYEEALGKQILILKDLKEFLSFKKASGEYQEIYLASIGVTALPPSELSIQESYFIPGDSNFSSENIQKKLELFSTFKNRQEDFKNLWQEYACFRLGINREDYISQYPENLLDCNIGNMKIFRENQAILIDAGLIEAHVLLGEKYSILFDDIIKSIKQNKSDLSTALSPLSATPSFLVRTYDPPSAPMPMPLAEAVVSSPLSSSTGKAWCWTAKSPTQAPAPFPNPPAANPVVGDPSKGNYL